MAISIEEFYGALRDHDAGCMVGVPDSLLKSFCSYAQDHSTQDAPFMIAANEGNAVAIAAGYYISSGKYSVVYMQNSGIGNAVNPLLSLCDKEVYSIPMLLLVGWRGEPGVKDEPQHVKQGKVTVDLFKAMGIKCEVLDESCYRQQIDGIFDYLKANQSPYALIVKKGAFTSYSWKPEQSLYPMSREEALKTLVSGIPREDFIVSTTGKTSRELFEIREANNEPHSHDFLTVGSMGHASSIAFGMSFGNQSKTIWCIDGDGAFIMHMGAAPFIAHNAASNLKYIVNVNGAHESVGGQPTLGFDIDLPGILRDSGFSQVLTAKTSKEIMNALEMMKGATGPCALVLYTRQGSRSDLGRPTIPPCNNKIEMMKAFQE